MCSETCKLAIFSQTANMLIKFVSNNCHGHGGKIKCNTQKYFLDPVQDDGNFPTATGEHFAVAAVAAAVDIT